MNVIRIFCFLLILILTSCKIGDNSTEDMAVPSTWLLKSPDGNLQVNVVHESSNGQLNYTISRINGKDTIQVLESSPLGIERENQKFDEGLDFVSSSDIRTINEQYTLTRGKQLENRNHAKEILLTFANPDSSLINITFRAYNDGIAFRYAFPEGEGDNPLTVTKELTGFKVPANGTALIQPYDTVSMWTPAYEKYYLQGEVGDVSPNPAGWAFPALFNTNNTWILLTESNLGRNYFGAHLQNGEQEGIYTIAQPDPEEAMGMGSENAISTTPWEMPWRLVMVGNDLATVVESNLVTHVADEQKAGDFSWVKPGKSSWSWWSDQVSPKDYNSLKKFVDFSADMGWEYSLVDANWNEMKGGNLEKLAKYANEKNVGLWVWYNSGGEHNTVTEQPRDIMSDPVRRKEEFKKLQQMGVKGVKIDFFQSDKQFIIEQYLDILKDAAEHQIMVNFHGSTIPRGWSRTWPNLLSLESVRGGESYLFASDFPEKAPSHNVHLVFTRNIIGPMDYTPVTFSDNKFPHITTNAHELALGVVFETGILHLADAVESYKNMPEAPKNFIKNLPVTWDETKLLSGSPTTDALLARKKGTEWYVGYINGENKAKEVPVDFSFLEDGQYTVSVISDGKESRSFASQDFEIDNKGTKNIAALPNGGFVMVIRKH